MEPIECIIYEPPVAKGRARTTVIGGHVRQYTPKKTTNSEAMIKALIRTEVLKLGNFEAGVPLRVDATFYREKPKSAPRRVTMPVSKPDLDNYLKLLLDALNKYIFPDDNQIVSVNMKKRFGNPPRIEVMIREEVA